MTTHRIRGVLRTAALALAAVALPAAAKPAPQPAPTGRPTLIVAMAVDQFSADLFAQYRNRFTGGFARLLKGAVFPAGYQSHAATETCPGHSTILTGQRPAHTGIVANNWFDQRVGRAKKLVYCAEDETQTAATPGDYVASVNHLLVPTLGDLMKAANPASRVIAVSGKDRAALMMGGHHTDEVYWWKGKGFTTLVGRQLGASAITQNAVVTKLLGTGAPGFALPADCMVADRPVLAHGDDGKGITVGTGRFALARGEGDQLRISPRLDAMTLDLAARAAEAARLGKGTAPDLLAVSVSATDYVGHAYGTEGAEMCIQLHALDTAMGAFFARLDKLGVDYAVVLTADHGGFDLPERLDEQALPQASRVDKAFNAATLSRIVAEKLGGGLPSPLILGEGAFGDFYVNAAVPAARKAEVLAEARKAALGFPQVAAVLTADELMAVPMPTGSPETWTLAQRARASFHPDRSGDLIVLLNRGVVPIPRPGPGYVATHGSPWDYDRRVPMLFWRKGMASFEQPSPVETVDIAPTLAALIGLPTAPGAFDGRCLDLDAGPGTTCGAAR